MSFRCGFHRCASGDRTLPSSPSTSSTDWRRKPRRRVTIGQDAQQALMAYDWPGNVRQLQNVMERVLALSPGRNQITAADLPDEIRVGRPASGFEDSIVPEEGVELDRAVSAFERALITRALERTAGNKRQAAE